MYKLLFSVTHRNLSLTDTEQNEHSDSDESDLFIITQRRQLFENLDDSSATAYGENILVLEFLFIIKNCLNNFINS